MIAYIFGYGSLVHPEDWAMRDSRGKAIPGYLENHTRNFQVGINNQSSQYDSKHYLYKRERAQCLIGALGIWPQTEGRVNGVAIGVDEDLFHRIGMRERSYYLSDDLRDLFSEKLEKPLFTYYPKEENYQLYLRGKGEDSIFLPSHYLQYCKEGFRAHGSEEDFLRLTEMADYPVREMEFYQAPGVI